MKPIAAIVLSLFSVAAFARPEPDLTPPPIALRHVAVIDTSGGAVLRDRTLVIAGERITTLGHDEEVSIPPNTRVVDCRGKFLIPGLWDMHVHIASAEAYFPLFVANGVTGVRDMQALDPDAIYQWRAQTAERKVLGPRIVAAGALIDGPKPIWPGSLAAGTAREGREAVRLLKKRGADFVKVYSKLPRDAYFAIADEAKKQGLPFAGHVPDAITAVEAADAGQKSMEHFYGIWLACSTQEAKLRKELVDALATSDNPTFLNVMSRAQVKALDSYSPAKAQALFSHFAKKGTWQVPTLTAQRTLGMLGDERLTSDPRLKYMPAYLTVGWNPKRSPFAKTPELVAGFKRLYKKATEVVPAMHRAGVPFLAGTDTTTPYCFPGFSLHDELGFLVQSGLTPLEALRCATLNPARYLGLLKDLGTVEQAKIADLVLLDANPLEDIANTRRIAAVLVRGKLLEKTALQELLASAETPAKRKND
jgi:hypothetical protein